MSGRPSGLRHQTQVSTSHFYLILYPRNVSSSKKKKKPATSKYKFITPLLFIATLIYFKIKKLKEEREVKILLKLLLKG